MIDCGADWLGRLKTVDPTAIVLTHAHGDHAFGLAQGAACPVHATDETWSLIERFPLADRHTVEPRHLSLSETRSADKEAESDDVAAR